MAKLKLNQNIYIVLIVIFFLVVLIEGIFLFKDNLPSMGTGVSDSTLNRYATEVVEKCEKERYRPACYDEEIPKLMDEISMEDAFKVTRVVQDKDTSYTYCHVLGHELSAREVQKDPSRWKDVVARVPSGLCSNGGIHGAFQERFRVEFFTPEQVEQIKPELMNVCEARDGWNPTGLEQGSCYHALGHLVMYITKAEIKPSLDLCDEMAKKENGRDFSQLCYDGVFMQIFQPLEPEDFDLIAGKEVKANELYDFCKKFKDKERSSCWSEGWPLFFDQIMTPTGLVKHCSSAFLGDKSHSDRCYLGLFYVITAQMKFDTVRLSSFCSALPVPRDGECFASGASRMIETDYRNISKSVDFCKGASSLENQGMCYNELIKYSTFNFHPNSKEFYDLCNSLPGASKERCLERGSR